MTFGPAAFQAATGVSRETLDRLCLYADVLASWQKKINLVASGSMPDLWRRHMLDSAQLIPLAMEFAASGVWVDLGSGAGFPGLVAAVCLPTGWTVHLIESDQRKAAFLREAIRITGATAIVHAVRIEKLDFFPANIVSARALAPLADLLPFAERFWGDGTMGLFLKGRRLDDELAAVSDSWSLTYDVLSSRSDSSGRILRARTLSRVKP